MTIVKNIARGPRGIYLATGAMLMLEAGQISDDVQLAKGEKEAADKTAFLFDREAKAHNSRIPIEVGGASSEDLAAALARAEEAEASLEEAHAEIEALKAKLAAFDHDGDGNPGGGVNAEPATDDSVKAALELLDPAKGEDWTAAGLPAVDAVAMLAGGKVTRAQIEAIAPGLTRETAAKG